eukprot:scaffold42838_cov21-Tisochrysis_lutea.AAC.1
MYAESYIFASSSNSLAALWLCIGLGSFIMRIYLLCGFNAFMDPPLFLHQVYWFTVFNAPADEAVPPNAEARMADAIKYVKGWAWSLEETIRLD